MKLFDQLASVNRHVCPWWLAYTFDHRLRRLFHDPEKILGPYVTKGMTVADIGCGMGYFSIGLANLVGEGGSVIAADIQPKMLDVLEKRARKSGVDHLIKRNLCQPDDIGIGLQVDFVLAFWMMHEVPHRLEFLEQVFSMLGPGGKFLLAEPKLHVSHARVQQTLVDCKKVGFRILGYPRIPFSRAALLAKIESGSSRS